MAFDGTGISVFELKREIITMNRLGDGTDFELIISSEDNNEGTIYSVTSEAGVLHNLICEQSMTTIRQ